jgi:photosystem II stability/assembly factor-like uncharacterized protein
MDTTTRDERRSPRARRAILLILAAVLVTAGTSVVYLKPSLLSHSPPAKAVGPAVLSSDYGAAYSFVSASLGWALVIETAGTTPRFSVFKTTDAAKHWKRQFVHQPTSLNFFHFPGMIQFFDPNYGVIAIGVPMEIYRTSDGGAHWALVRTPNYPTSYFVPADALHGWLLGWIGHPEQVPDMFSTSDGGDTWIALPNALAWASAWSAFRGNVNLFFRNPREGWFGASTAEPVVYSSADGGVSWQPHTLPSNVDPNLCPTAAGVSTYVTLLPGHGVVAILEYCAHVEGYTSVDGGATWQPLASPPGWNFAYQDSSHWWTMQSGTLWKTSDSGRSWTLVSKQSSDWDYVLHVIDAKYAWAELFTNAPGLQGGAGLAVTSDGGLHWSQVSAPQPG